MAAAAPHGTDRVDDPLGEQVVAASGLRLAGVAAAEAAAFVEQAGAGSEVDGAVDPATAE